VTTFVEVDPNDPKTVRVVLERWRLWESDAGVHYATRCSTLSEEQMAAGAEMTISDDTPQGRERKIIAQSRLGIDGD
jgi:hypothetical protein